jgi:hypothetical protein
MDDTWEEDPDPAKIRERELQTTQSRYQKVHQRGLHLQLLS